MYCPFCGVEIPNDSAFCGFCGKKIPPNESEAVSEPADSAEVPENTVFSTGETAAEIAENTASTVSEIVAEAPEDTASTASETAVEAPEDTASTASETAVEAPEDTASTASEIVAETLGDTASTASETVVETTEIIASTASEIVAEASENTASTASETVAEIAEDTALTVGETVGETSENTASTSSETSAETAENVTSSLSEAADESKDNTKPQDDNVSGIVTYDQPDDTAFKEVKARRAFSVTALLKNKLFLICAGAVLVLIILIIIAVNSAIKNADVNPLKGSYYSVTADGETIFFYNGERIKNTDFSPNKSVSAVSEDGVTALVADSGTLTLLSKGKASEITDELDSERVVLSANGKTALYISDSSLIAYSDGKETKISELDTPALAVYAVSPDGGTVVFADYNKDYSLKSANGWKGGKLINLDAKIVPILVSNGGKIVYGIKNNDLVYIKNLKDDSDEKIKRFSGLIASTADNSGLIFSSDSGTYYFDGSLTDAVKITKRDIFVLNEGSYPMPRKNLKSFYAVSESGVYKITGKKDDFESERVISGASMVSLSADGKTFVYMDDDELVKVSALSPDKENVIADDVYSYNCDPSLKHIYYIDEDGNLRYVSSKRTKICSDVGSYTVNFEGVCVFSSDDGDLYYSSKGGDRKKVSGISDVQQISMVNGIIYVRADDSLYVSTDGKKFDKTGIDF